MSTYNVTQPNVTVAMDNATFDVQAGASLNLTGSWDTVTLENGTQGLTLQGNDNQVNAGSLAQTTQITVYGSANAVNVASLGAYASVNDYGDGDTFTLGAGYGLNPNSMTSYFNEEGTRLDSIPATLPYLYANSHASRQWETRIATLQPGRLPRIGVVWAGGHSGTVVDRRRSVPVEALASLLEWPHAHWFSLQKAESEDKQLPHPQRLKVIDWMDEVEDFADTAALVDTLDLVISVDTSVAHLAAAMGKPVWLLNRFAGCWRWLRERDDSPWYPGMRIFTQRERGDWPEVLQRVLSTLQGEYAPGAR